MAPLSLEAHHRCGCAHDEGLNQQPPLELADLADPLPPREAGRSGPVPQRAVRSTCKAVACRSLTQSALETWCVWHSRLRTQRPVVMDTKNRFMLVLVLALCGGAVALVVVATLTTRDRSDHEVSAGAADLVLSATQMTHAFRQDSASAESLFRAKVIELTGVIGHVEAGHAGTEILVTGEGEDLVECIFSEELRTLEPAMRVRVRGKYCGRSTLSQILGVHLDTSINGCLTNCALLESWKP